MIWYKKGTAVLLAFVMAVVCSACGEQPDKTAKGLDIEQEMTVYVWYCDQKYTPYLEYVAGRFHEVNGMVTINPVLVSSENYLETIYEQSVHGSQTADVYLLSSNDLEKACMMGLAVENSTYASYYTEKKYGTAARTASIYRQKLYGYPVSFNTAFMVYNKKYVSPVETFTQLTDFCTQYTVTDENQEIQQIITWDVSDMLINYGFSSGYLMVGGESGEDSASVKVNSEELKKAMNAFVALKEDYGITRTEIDMDTALQRFSEGKLAYTITDINGLEQIDASGIEYGVCEVPNLTQDLSTQTLSETTIALVNPYASDLELAKAVAHALSYDYAGSFNELTGLLSARSVSYDKKHRESYKIIHRIYGDSIVQAQFIGAGDLYSRYEIMIHKIWDGMEVNTAVDAFIAEILSGNVSAGQD